MSQRLLHWIVHHSHDVPRSSVLIGSNDLMSLPSNLLHWVSVENFKSLNNLVLISGWWSVAHVVENLIPDLLVFVVSEFKYSFPKFRYVFLHVTWAHFLHCSHLDLFVLVPREFDQIFNLISCLYLVQNIPNFFLRFLISSFRFLFDLLWADLLPFVSSFLWFRFHFRL